ncbi:hypothetical protein SLS53_005662 [Cytospora paraplurivora]|uniref:Uncharacterized protein n=1 Tax=Cytospora paraplurivora TaxID=2898453 RepID=A0AAN9YEU2_9PEZI
MILYDLKDANLDSDEAPGTQEEIRRYTSRRLKVGTPWMNRMLKNGLLEHGVDCWGFVVFRTGIWWQRGSSGMAEIPRPKFRAVFVEDKELDDSSNEQLRARFRNMCDGDGGEQLPKETKTNCCLVADMAIIKIEAAKESYIDRS